MVAQQAVVVFIKPECRCCMYRLYNSELKDYKPYLDEEPAPNCNRTRCLIDNRAIGGDITRFINNGWIIKSSKEETRTENGNGNS